MQTVAIVGVGLIGGSFALALRRAGFDGPVLGVSSPGAIREAQALGAIDKGVPLEEAAARADLIYLSQTIERILETIRALGPLVRPGCLITDAGSTKLRIVGQARRHLPPGAFLGGHPMAGKETRGAATAEASLFEGRTYVLTPDAETPATLEFRNWLERIGALTVTMEPGAHDGIVALTSHLPQLASTALASLLATRLDEEARRIAGPGLKDMTRLALSPYGVWRDILATNPGPIAAALDAYIEELRRLRAEIESPAMQAAFEQASELSHSIRQKG